jgi:hypothetical protein
LKLYISFVWRYDNEFIEMGFVNQKITANIPIKRIQLLKIKHSPYIGILKRVSVKRNSGWRDRTKWYQHELDSTLDPKIKQHLITLISQELTGRRLSDVA